MEQRLIAEERDKKIIRTSIVGILANILLAAFKAAVGLASHSVAIVLDAVNNLSDAMSSLITIIGTKLAGKEPDRKHPFGHGRVEYLSAMVISAIVLYAGVTALIESVKKILDPAVPDYSPVALVIVAAAVLVKILLGRYVKGVGEKVDSDSLIASGKDATFDAVLSFSTLVAAVIYITAHISLEAWLGAIISLFIIKAGVDMLRETISEILGERIEAEIAANVRRTVTSFPEVLGAYDLVIHNYGPKQLVGSVHIEVPEDLTARQLDKLERQIAQKVYTDLGIAMTGISVYSMNMSNDKAVEMRKNVAKIAADEPFVLQMHGFYLDEEAKSIRFDAVIDFDAESKRAVCDSLETKVKALYPDYQVNVLMDYDLSDI